jgi:hypothetical protein
MTLRASSFAEPPDGDFDRRNQIALLERLDQVRQRTGVPCLFHDLALGEGRQDQHPAEPFLVDESSDVEAGHAGHLDVEYGQIGLQLADQIDGVVAATGLSHDFVPLFLEGLFQIETDDGLVLGDDDSDRHGGSLGSAVRP